MSANPTSFSNLAEFEEYTNQFIAQFQMPSQEQMYQMVTTCWATIGQHMPQPVKPADKLSLKQVALLHIYNEKVITKGKQADGIAVEYGHNSGDKLYDFCRVLTKKRNRTAVTGRKATFLLKDIAIVKTRLEGVALAWAEQEEQEIKIRKKMKFKS